MKIPFTHLSNYYLRYSYMDKLERIKLMFPTYKMNKREHGDIEPTSPEDARVNDIAAKSLRDQNRIQLPIIGQLLMR